LLIVVISSAVAPLGLDYFNQEHKYNKNIFIEEKKISDGDRWVRLHFLSLKECSNKINLCNQVSKYGERNNSKGIVV
jgi:hypothetical protein